MILQWKAHSIDLSAFNTFLKENITSADGIVADSDKFEIVETTPFTDEEKSIIQVYYDSLVE